MAVAILEQPKDSWFVKMLNTLGKTVGIKDYEGERRKFMSDLSNSENSNQKRLNIVSNFFKKHSDIGKTMCDDRGTPLMFHAKTQTELNIFLKYIDKDFQNASRETLFENEAKSFFQGVNNNTVQFNNFNKLNLLISKGANISKYGEGILLLKLNPDTFSKELISNIKRNHPSFVENLYKNSVYKDTHLNNECNELFSNLNNDSLSSDNLKRISLLLDNNANIQQYAEGLLSLEKNELTQELFTKFPNEAKQLNDILSKVKEKHPFLVEKKLSSVLTDNSIDKKAEVFLEKFVSDFENSSVASKKAVAIDEINTTEKTEQKVEQKEEDAPVSQKRNTRRER